jgi:hypothetical protein
MKKIIPEPAIGWALRVGGSKSQPYIWPGKFSTTKEGIEQECYLSYHRPIKVAMIPLAEYRKLIKTIVE